MSENSQLTTEQLKRRIEATIERKSVFSEKLELPLGVEFPDAGATGRAAITSPTSPGPGQISPSQSSQTVLQAVKKFVNRIPVIGGMLRWTARLVLMPVRFHRLQSTSSRRFKDLYAQQTTLKGEIAFLQAHLLELRDVYEGQLEELENRSKTLTDDMHVTGTSVEKIQAAAETHASYISALNDQIQVLEGRSGQLETQARTLGVGLEDARIQVSDLTSNLFELRNRLLKVGSLPEFLGPNQLDPGYQVLDTFLESIDPIESEEQERDRLYNAIEVVLRGPKELIADRQAHYLPTLEQHEIMAHAPLVDIGCGRGEFLDLLRENGYQGIGVETNVELVERLTQEGHRVFNTDGLGYLTTVPDNSLAGITAFQVIEHLPHDYLRDMLKTAYAKLKPSGFILLETVNPHCLETFRRYYQDPTHQPPVPFELLAIMLRFYGFEQIETFFQSPLPIKGEVHSDQWMQHYQDYALIGRKNPSDSNGTRQGSMEASESE
jgi:SAM-dependent methyltransferase